MRDRNIKCQFGWVIYSTMSDPTKPMDYNRCTMIQPWGMAVHDYCTLKINQHPSAVLVGLSTSRDGTVIIYNALSDGNEHVTYNTIADDRYQHNKKHIQNMHVAIATDNLLLTHETLFRLQTIKIVHYGYSDNSPSVGPLMIDGTCDGIPFDWDIDPAKGKQWNVLRMMALFTKDKEGSTVG